MAEAGHPTDECTHISIHNSFRFPNIWILCQPGCHTYKQRAQQAEIRTSYGQLCRQRRVILAPVAEVLVRPDRGALRMDDRVDLERKNEFTWNSHPSLFIFLFPRVPVIPLVLLRLNQDTLSVALVHSAPGAIVASLGSFLTSSVFVAATARQHSCCAYCLHSSV
jgi:hypothetical protein